MIAKLVSFALRQPFVIVVASLALMVWGAWSFQKLPIDAYPDLSPPHVELITQWPGHAPEEIERQVVQIDFGKDGKEEEQVLTRTTSGGVTVNDVIMHISMEDLPFGGTGPSGMGSYHGIDGFRTFRPAVVGNGIVAGVVDVDRGRLAEHLFDDEGG